jgi:hypothetical protein
VAGVKSTITNAEADTSAQQQQAEQAITQSRKDAVRAYELVYAALGA